MSGVRLGIGDRGGNVCYSGVICAAECKSECYSPVIFLHKEGSVDARFWRYHYKSAFGIDMYIALFH
jgi:hypothetical protein